MDNKKIGGVLLGSTIVLLLFFLLIIQTLNTEIESLGCFAQPGCQKIETSLSLLHGVFGVFGFLFALGCYLLFFSPAEEAILRRLEADSNKKLSEDRFSLILKGVDSFEREVITAVKEQPGITQNTLRLRVNMSKAKLSQVLALLEKKGLIKREEKGKTLAIFLKVEL